MGNRQINHGRRRRRRSLLCVLMSEVCSKDDFTRHFCSLKGAKKGLKIEDLKIFYQRDDYGTDVNSSKYNHGLIYS